MIFSLRFIVLTGIFFVLLGHPLSYLNAQKPENQIINLAWNTDSSKLAIAFQDRHVSIYSIESQVKLGEFSSSLEQLSIAWSPLGDQIAIGNYYSDDMELWNSTIFSLNHTFQLPKGNSTNQVYWSPDGQYLITIQADGGYFNIFDITTQTFLLNKILLNPTDIAWSSSHTTIAISYLHPHIVLIDAENFTEIGYLGLSIEQIRASRENNTYLGNSIIHLDWSQDDTYILTGATGGEVTLWEVATNTIIYQDLANNLDRAESENNQLIGVRDVWVSSDNSTFNSLARDGTYRSWSMVSGERLVDVHLGTLTFIATASPDKTQLAYVDEANELHIITLTYTAIPADFTAHLATCTTDATLQAEWQHWLDDNDLSTLETAITEARGDTLTVECANELLIMLDVLEPLDSE